jgi:hypothetical protein
MSMATLEAVALASSGSEGEGGAPMPKLGKGAVKKAVTTGRKELNKALLRRVLDKTALMVQTSAADS